MLSEAFPTNYTPSGGEDFLTGALFSENNNQESVLLIQPCFRYQDLKQLNTGYHLPFFDMGVALSIDRHTYPFFIKQIFMFFNSLGLNKKKLSVTVFGGEMMQNIFLSKDEEAYKTWVELGIPDDQIKFLGIQDNFFLLKQKGYGGVRTEVFYDYEGKRIEIGTVIKLTVSVNSRKSNDDLIISSFNRNVFCLGIGLNRLAMLMEEREFISNFDNSELYEKFTNERGGCFNKFDFYSIYSIIKGVVIVIIDGGCVFDNNQSRRKLFRKILRNLISLTPNNYRNVLFYVDFLNIVLIREACLFSSEDFKYDHINEVFREGIIHVLSNECK